MKQNGKPLNFDERVKAHSPLWFEYAKRHGLTPEQYQTIEDKQENAWRKRQRTSLLPFPLPDKYKNDGDSLLPRDALDAVNAYRLLLLRFGPDPDEDEDQLKKATDVALGIRLAWSDEWNLELAEVPLAKNFKGPTDEDFARLEQWFLTAANAIKNEIGKGSEAAAAPRTLEQWAAGREAVLAVVFTDIVGSTAMRERLGDERMDRLLKGHFDSATPVVRCYHGCLVDKRADETLAFFRTASDALCFARTLQTQPGGPNLRIRAAIHVGQISIKGNKPSGQTLNYAKRVMEEAPRGGICLSNQAKADIAQQGRPQLLKVKYRAKPNVKLKGIKGKCTVWLVLKKARP